MPLTKFLNLHARNRLRYGISHRPRSLQNRLYIVSKETKGMGPLHNHGIKASSSLSRGLKSEAVPEEFSEGRHACTCTAFTNPLYEPNDCIGLYQHGFNNDETTIRVFYSTLNDRTPASLLRKPQVPYHKRKLSDSKFKRQELVTRWSTRPPSSARTSL